RPVEPDPVHTGGGNEMSPATRAVAPMPPRCDADAGRPGCRPPGVPDSTFADASAKHAASCSCVDEKPATDIVSDLKLHAIIGLRSCALNTLEFAGEIISPVMPTRTASV